MNELKLIVKHATLYQNGVVTVCEPFEEVFHERGNVDKWRRHIYNVTETVHHADIAISELTRTVNQTFRQ